ncbi:MAG: hypothetical protein QG610_1520 [Euryarchaeota archaeon]|nr:hypothetical protein [Euryarchaeota archaeon]
MKIQNLRDPVMKNLLCITLFLFAYLFASVSATEATEIVLDTDHHHLGDDFKEDLNPGDPEGLIYKTTFTLDLSVEDPLVDIESAELTLTGKNIVPGPTDEFLDKVYINEIEIGNLNDYIPAGTQDSDSVKIAIPIHPSFFDPETNTIKISSGSNATGSNYDDFEFYDLSLYIGETEPVTLTSPLILYFPPIAIAGMLILLATILKKSNNRPLAFGSWLIVLAGVLLLSLIIIDPYAYELSLLGFLAFFTFWSLPVILLIGIVFLIYGIRKRKK